MESEGIFHAAKRNRGKLISQSRDDSSLFLTICINEWWNLSKYPFDLDSLLARCRGRHKNGFCTFVRSCTKCVSPQQFNKDISQITQRSIMIRRQNKENLMKDPKPLSFNQPSLEPKPVSLKTNGSLKKISPVTYVVNVPEHHTKKRPVHVDAMKMWLEPTIPIHHIHSL